MCTYHGGLILTQYGLDILHNILSLEPRTPKTKDTHALLRPLHYLTRSLAPLGDKPVLKPRAQEVYRGWGGGGGAVG